MKSNKVSELKQRPRFREVQILYLGGDLNSICNSGVKDKRGGWQLFLKKCASHIVDCAPFCFPSAFFWGFNVIHGVQKWRI